MLQAKQPYLKPPTVRRLNEVIRVLQGVRMSGARTFSLETWVYYDFDKHGQPCGTTACAVGWASLDPWFRKNGLRFDRHDPAPRAFKRFQVDGCREWKNIDPHEWFGLSKDQFRYLFFPAAYRTKDHRNKQAVIERIRRLIRNDGIVRRTDVPAPNRNEVFRGW